MKHSNLTPQHAGFQTILLPTQISHPSVTKNINFNGFYVLYCRFSSINFRRRQFWFATACGHFAGITMGNVPIMRQPIRAGIPQNKLFELTSPLTWSSCAESEGVLDNIFFLLAEIEVKSSQIKCDFTVNRLWPCHWWWDPCRDYLIKFNSQNHEMKVDHHDHVDVWK